MKEYDKKIFATNLRRLMETNEVKASDLCELLSVSKSTVSSWYTAQKIPRMDKVQALADYFGVMKSDLIEEKPATTDDDWIPSEYKELIELYRAASPELQAAALGMLEAAERARLARGSSSKDK